MITIISLCLGFLVGAVIVGIAKTDLNQCPHWDYDIKAGKLSTLESKIYVLESENKRLNYIYENLTRDKRIFQEYMMSHCINCNKNFYAKTPKEQDVADLLKKITLTSEEIAEKLDIKIYNN